MWHEKKRQDWDTPQTVNRKFPERPQANAVGDHTVANGTTRSPSQPSRSRCQSVLVFRRKALFISFFMWSKMLMLKLRVEETKMSISDMTVSMATTWTPSKHACRAQKGSHSATNTRAPEPRESESANLANIAISAHQR